MNNIKDLSLDQDSNVYTGTVTLDGNEVSIAIHMTDGQQDKQYYLGLANSISNWYESNSGLVKDFIVDSLLHVKNDSWAQSEEEKETSASFIGKLNLKSIEILRSGSFDILFDAGDMFLGHFIVVRFSQDMTPKSCNLEG